MQVQEFIEALDLIGQIYRSSNGKKPADAIAKLKAQLAGSEVLTVAEWVSLRSPGAANGEARTPPPPAPEGEDLEVILQELEQAANSRSSEAAFQKLEALSLTTDEWKKLAKLAAVRGAKSGKAAKDGLRNHLANRVQLHNRRESVAQIFP